MTRIGRLAVLCSFLSHTVLLAQSNAPLSAAPHADAVPAGLAAPLAARLGKSGVRVTVAKGPATLDFWFVESLPMKAGSGAPSWDDVEEGSLVGALNVSTDYRDIRAKILKPGLYTLRYGIQPDNGDHLGVSPFRAFLLLSPAAQDQDPKPTGHDGTIELSKASIGGSHPGVLSIDPPVATAATLSIHKTSLGHQAIVMEVPIARDGKPAGTLKFGIVLIGSIEA
jgi:hypothetical protein